LLYGQIEPLLQAVQKPSRYVGGELNMVVKDLSQIDLRFAFCFPDTYEVGMSHLGMKILYALLNAQAGVYCERAFAPWVDMEKALRDHEIPLYSLETFTPLAKFDILGFTLQYEMSYSNIANMLDLSGLQVLAAERGEEAPLVVCGGPCAFNPEPLAEIADLFFIGDGEEQMLEFIELFRQCRAEGLGKEDTLLRASRLRGCYAPRFYEAIFDESGAFLAIRRLRDDVPEKITRAVVQDLDAAFFPKELILPFSDIVFDRVMLEVARGCTRGCRFCQAGMLYRPKRERSLKTLQVQAENLLSSTGYEEISLSSLSTGDYSCLPDLVRSLIRAHEGDRVSVSLPSLRIDSVLGETLQESRSVRKTGLTFAPEAGSQRLRDVINKGVTAQDLLSSARDAFEKGWSALKLYFMIGLPTETLEDLDGIAELARGVTAEYFTIPKEQRPKGLRVSCSASSFVPKPFTPFQWGAQNTIDELSQKQRYLREKLKMRGVEFSWHAPHLSALEAAFSRGDRRLSRVLVRAQKLGCSFDGWSDQFKFEAWVEAFKLEGLRYEQFAYKEYELDEPLPWDHIDAGVTKAYLKAELERAKKGLTTPDCSLNCQGCGMARILKGACGNCA
jgi:radical SAM family uncharacterized protein